MNKGSIVERLCSDLIAKSRDINGLLYFTYLNPVDYKYKIWGVMQERVYKTAIKDLDDLKRHLIVEWSGLQQSIIDDAVDRLDSGSNVCVAA